MGHKNSLAKKIILSGKEKNSQPLKSFLMSFALTGMGEVYSGYPQRGIAFALLRSMSCLAVPFHSLMNPGSIMLTEVFITLILFLTITILSPLTSLYITLKKKKIILSQYNSTGFYSAFIIINIIITVFSIAVFSGSFSLIKTQKAYPPYIDMGDILVIKKIGNVTYKKSDLIMRNDIPDIVRIVSIPGENISYSNGRFAVDNTELILSIFNEIDLKSFSLTDYNVISESNGNYRYPVIQNKGKLRFRYDLKTGEYFTAPDNRDETAGFQLIKPENVLGRVEGILFSFKRSEFIIPPIQINE